jgi:hypothetical protein
MYIYMWIVFIHVLASVVLLGDSVLGSPAVRAAVRRAETAQEVRAYLAIGRPLAVVTPIAALLVLASGIYLTSVIRFWALGWVQVATACWLLNGAVAGALVNPAIARTAADAAGANGPVSPRLHRLRWSARWSFGGDLLMANDLSILFVMVMKPALTGSLLAVAAANTLVLSGRLCIYLGHAARAARARSADAGRLQLSRTATPAGSRSAEGEPGRGRAGQLACVAGGRGAE